MSQASAKSKNSAQLIAELEHMLKKRELGDQELPHSFVLSFNKIQYSPLTLFEIKSLADRYSQFKSALWVKRAHEDEFVSILEHPSLISKRPNLVSIEGHKNDDEITEARPISNQYWVLKKGFKTGPFTPDEISQQLTDHHLFSTDLISDNDGEVWLKIYQYPHFDRRRQENEELPQTPRGEIFNKSLHEVKSQLATPDIERLEFDAVTGLAYLSNLRTGKGIELKAEKYRGDLTDPNIKRPQANQQNEGYPYFWYGLFFVSLAGIAIISLTWRSPELPAPITPVAQEGTPGRTPASVAPGEVPKIEGTPIERVQRKAAPPKITPTKTTRRAAPTSIIQSQAYQKAQAPTNHEADNDYYYDDGTGPIEQDPIRSRASRELINPDPEDNWARAAAARSRAPASSDDESFDDYEEEYEPLEPYDDY